VYREDGVDHTTDAGKLFNYDRPMDLFPSLNIEGYPNRNSLVYESVYGIEGADTILRGTLRFKGFCKVMRAMQSMGLFAEASVPAGGTNWAKCVASVLNASGSDARAAAEDFLKTGGASPSDIRYILDTLDRLGLLSDTEPVPNAPSVIDAVCSQLEKKLQYGPGERDMVLLSHQFVASWPDGSESDISSTFVRCGDPNGHTAMAETVGIPCALGVEHVLRGTVSGAGVIRPVDRALYKPLLADLEKLGISMIEEERPRPM
jgi:saccharopine dehydrogenase-like NADP-dependent oxidoreductase